MYRATYKNKILIHTPTGERPRQTLGDGLDLVFQSTLPQGERLMMWQCMDQLCRFQSTLPQGERQWGRWYWGWFWYFNPRSRKGSDRFCHPNRFHNCKFQSTLPQGERRFIFWIIMTFLYISIHAPARGATSIASSLVYFSLISIHAPARGATAIMHKIYHQRLA